MNKYRFVAPALAGAGILGLSFPAGATDAPALAEHATIVAPGDKGAMRTLRTGTNGFTCMPDNPETPGPDPMCWDKNAGDWIDAYLNHKAPPAGKVGLMYMLAGGTDA